MSGNDTCFSMMVCLGLGCPISPALMPFSLCSGSVWDWAEFHLSEGNGEIFAFPLRPDYALRETKHSPYNWCIPMDLIHEEIQYIYIYIYMAVCIAWSQLLYLVVGVCVIKAVEIGLMAVLIPPAASVGHGTARDERLRVSVPRGERPSVMVRQWVTCTWIHAEFYRCTISSCLHVPNGCHCME